MDLASGAVAISEHNTDLSAKNTSDEQIVEATPDNVDVTSEPSEQRKSDRTKAKQLVTNILTEINTISEYHEAIVNELENNPEFVRLNAIHDELTDMSNIQAVIKQYDQYRAISEAVGSSDVQSVKTAIDRVNADRVNLIERVSIVITRLSTRPKSNSLGSVVAVSNKTSCSNSRKTQTRSNSTSYRTGSSRRTSRSSKLIEMAVRSRVLIAEKESKLQTEMQTLQMEAELETLEKQKDAVKRSMRAAKAQGELEAERRRHTILLQAAEEEIQAEQAGSLLQRSSRGLSHIRTVQFDQVPVPQQSAISLAQSDTPNSDSVRNNTEHTLQPNVMPTNSSTTVQANERNTHAPTQAVSQVLSGFQDSGSINNTKIDKQHSTYREPYTPTQQLQHATQPQITQNIAKEITDHMHISLVAPPEPGKFDGHPLEYADWRVAFDSLIGSKKGTAIEKLYRLRNYVQGDAFEAISGYFRLQSDAAYREALDTLHDEFGRDDIVEESFRDQLESWPKIAHKDYESLKKYSFFLKQCLAAQSSIAALQVLDQKRENRKFIKALPEWAITKWLYVVTDAEEGGKGFPPFSRYVKFVAHEAKACTNRLREANPTDHKPSQLPKQSHTSNSNARVKSKGTKTTLNTARQESTKQQEQQLCRYCEIPGHSVQVCRKFTGREKADKDDFIRQQKLCYGCLKPGHMIKQCSEKAKCNVCQRMHPTSLHSEPQPAKAPAPKPSETDINKSASSNPKLKDKGQQESKSQNTQSQPAKTTHAKQSTTAATGRASCSNISMCSMTLPVYVSVKSNPSVRILTYALLDPQSNTTYMTLELADQLSAQRKPVDINLTTMTSHNETQQSHIIQNLQVTAFTTEEAVDIDTTYASKTLPAIIHDIATSETVRQWSHLQEVADKLEGVPTSTHVGLLIGYDQHVAFQPYETISREENEPWAVRCKLGWYVMGPAGESKGTQRVCHKIITKDPTDQAAKSILLTQKHKTRKNAPFSEEILNILQQDFNSVKQTRSLSVDDQKFLDIVSKNIHKDRDGYITMPLPLKSKPQAVNSKAAALHRFKLLESKMNKDDTYKQQYHSFMEDVISRGEAEVVREADLSAEGWYLPHFGIFHPKKPNKIRVVFDASAKVNGSSLNDYLLEGPAHMNNLIGILLRFRKERVAIMCDVERMFHNFRVSASDRNYLRFLWYHKGKVADYRMKVHIFGAKSSPAVATFGLRHLASAKDIATPVGNFIKNDFYVDDGVASVSTSKEAQEIIEGAREACRSGKLRLHKFVSNDSSALMNLPETERAQNTSRVKMGYDFADHKITERALGLEWDTDKDIFKFFTVDSHKPSTRKGVLSTVASIYDPLGLVSPYILQGKHIVQMLCKQKVDWDDFLDQPTQELWNQWKENLNSLEQLSIPRCNQPADFGKIAKVEIHNFSDASTTGYGQCSYLRLVSENGDIHVTLLMSKARVAPVKVISIPRMELQAACTSIEVSRFVKEQLLIENVEEIFWTDSKVTLAYINNEARRFHVYVANRVQTIRDYSEPPQWHYVPTEQNPADMASRGSTPHKLMSSNWFHGPEFLYQEPVQLTKPRINADLDQDDPEVKHVTLLVNTQLKPLHQRLTKFSSWKSAIRGITWLQQSIRQKKNCQLDKISATENAKLLIIKSVQASSYQQEISNLKQGKPLKGNSALLKLCPFLDEKGLLRVGGRLQQGDMDYAEKHPIILPKESHISDLVIGHYHQQTAHQGRGFTLAKLRGAGYWVVSAHKKVASYIHHCVICRKDRGKTCQQIMAPLPVERTIPAPPFSYAGIDCFGPFMVKDGRKEYKRWGLLVTCMASRAIHIELLEDMTADALLNAIRTIISIRGNIRQIRCDRGTNFVGALSELTKQSSQLNIEFSFNPPHASHMGGAWERHIRTVRNILKDVARKYGGRFRTSTLRTALYEIMSIINSRPLSIVTEEQTPLNPNMLLTMKSDITLPPPGRFDESDVYSRKRWIQVQAIASQFWQRYRKEYLNQLQTRNKWVKPARNIQVGDIVSVDEGDCMKNDWKLAKVVQCNKSSDGHVRSVRLQIGTSKNADKPVELERPIAKLILLVEAE